MQLGVVEGQSHSLYGELIGFPPTDIEYTSKKSFDVKRLARKNPLAARFRWNSPARFIAFSAFSLCLRETEARSTTKLPLRMNPFLHGPLYDSLYGGETTDFDVLHSAGSAMLERVPWIVRNDIKWMVDLEHVGSLFGIHGNWRRRIYDKSWRKLLTKQLASKYCRRILPWTEAARETIRNILPSKVLEEKTQVLRLAIRKAPSRPANVGGHETVRILFVGSANFQREFWSKGGFEVLESYRRLRERLGSSVELTFRCAIPDQFRKKYGDLPGITVVSDVLPRSSLDRLFWESDVFLFPAHNTPGLAFLEAMRFGLPVVAKDIWANREIVKDGLTGFLVQPSLKIPYCLPGRVPNWSNDDGHFAPFMKIRDDRVIDNLVECISRLVESPSLRRRMGAAGIREVEEGDASIEKRNGQLERIYRDAAEY